MNVKRCISPPTPPTASPPLHAEPSAPYASSSFLPPSICCGPPLSLSPPTQPPLRPLALWRVPAGWALQQSIPPAHPHHPSRNTLTAPPCCDLILILMCNHQRSLSSDSGGVGRPEQRGNGGTNECVTSRRPQVRTAHALACAADESRGPDKTSCSSASHRPLSLHTVQNVPLSILTRASPLATPLSPSRAKTQDSRFSCLRTAKYPT